MDVANIKLAILQVGYARNKAGYKWTEIEDKFPLFLAARQIWSSETEGQEPKGGISLVISPAAIGRTAVPTKADGKKRRASR